MKNKENSKSSQGDVIQLDEIKEIIHREDKTHDAFSELERAIFAALENYSNVHRGSGHKSLVTTNLYEEARNIVLEYLGLKIKKYTVLFCSPRRAEIISGSIGKGRFSVISSGQFGLALGVFAIAVRKKYLPESIPFQSGGGTTRLYDKNWIIWANSPDRFEAGTPAIINVIAFAKALKMMMKNGKEIFSQIFSNSISAREILYEDEFLDFRGGELMQKLRETMIGHHIQVPTQKGLQSFINLDNSASTSSFFPVWEVFRKTLHQPAEIRKQLIKEVKMICSNTLGAPMPDYEIIFTSGTTESINLVAESMGILQKDEKEGVILSSMLEHSSNDLPWRNIPGYSIIRLSTDKEGFFNLNELQNLLEAYNKKYLYGKKRIKIVAVSGASNVLGTCNNLLEISKLVHQYDARLLVDAAQLIAHRPIEMKRLDIDYLAFSAHKVFAPFGSGALIVKKGMLNFRSDEIIRINASGEENAGGIAAMGKSLLLLQRIGFDTIQDEEQKLTALALNGLKDIPMVNVYGTRNSLSPNFLHKVGVIVFDIKDRMAGGIANKLAFNRGIGVRYGCHCAHLIIKYLFDFTPFLVGFQKAILRVFPMIKLQGMVRISFSIENTESDVAILLEEMKKIVLKTDSSRSKTQSATINGEYFIEKAEIKKQIRQYIQEVKERVYCN